ncbi:MAG: hypothetical protein Q4C82_06570 [Eubacteriales bacterium]|nr:hypothetical protein [Eubacteriales bacterium]
MKRKYMAVMLAALAASAVMLTGCAGSGAQSGETAQETDGEDDGQSGEPEQTAQSGEEQTPETDQDAPLRIWGTITDVGTDSIVVDNQSENSSAGEMILNIDPDSTYVLDGAEGLPVALEDVETGSFEAYLGDAMTMSLPPQTTPYMVIVNIPEDAQAPLYVTAEKDAEEQEDGSVLLTASDGSSYTISPDAQVLPYLTKNIVTLQDLTEGTSCLLWLDEQQTGQKVVVFAK